MGEPGRIGSLHFA